MQINKYIDLSLKNEEAGLEESLGKERVFFPIPPSVIKDPQDKSIVIYSHRVL